MQNTIIASLTIALLSAIIFTGGFWLCVVATLDIESMDLPCIAVSDPCSETLGALGIICAVFGYTTLFAIMTTFCKIKYNLANILSLVIAFCVGFWLTLSIIFAPIN